MKFSTLALPVLAAILFPCAGSFAFQPTDHTRLADFDRRTDDGITNQVPPAGRPAAVEKLRSHLPQAQVEFDEISRAPKFISAGSDFLTGPGGLGKSASTAAAAGFATNDPYRPTKIFLQEHRALFGHGPEALSQARIRREFTTPHSGLKTVVWEQQVDGIPLYESVLISHTTREGELVNVASQFMADPEAAANRGVASRAALLAAPTVSARQAVKAAAQNIGLNLDDPAITADAENNGAVAAGPEQKQYFNASQFKGKAEAKLIWLPMSSDQLQLCWDVIVMSRAQGEMFRVLINAQTGEPLLRHCLTDYISDATYRVYTSDSPSPLSPSYSTPVTTQPPFTNRVLITLPALDTNASPAGWINDGVNETLGNNVDAHTDRNADNIADLPRPQGSPFRVFDFPLDLSQAPSTYTNAAVVQLFYWNNFMHDKLYQLGFTEAAGNFQVNNFGRGGNGNDAVQADAQDGSGFNNANFSTPPDGSAGRMQMYLFNGPTPNRDGDLDAEVILHEYTHGLSNRRVGGGVGISALQTGGMGEGWSDFYAMALLSEPGDDVNGVYAYGGYVTYQLSGLTQNYYFGIRRYPYCTDTNINPLTFKDIDTTQASTHTGIPRSPIIGTTANEVHNMGEVWCVTLREARANLINKYGWAVGNQLILQLVTDGMNLSPANPNFLQARDAILQADQVANGGVNLTELWTAFARRGMGRSATSPASSSTTAVHEAFDVPFQPLQIVIPSGATEGDGLLAGAGQVKLPGVVSSNVVVQLISSDTTEATVPISVTISAGQTNATFDLTIIDDAILDGTQTATITASASGFANAYGTISVFDNESATLLVTLPASAVEGQGTVTGTVQVSAVPATNITVSLSSSDTTEIQVPANIIIPTGQTSAVFTATVVDDNQIDGAQIATITAHVQNWTDGMAAITVFDNENLNLTVSLPASAAENIGVLTNAGVVSISGTLTTNLPVSLVSGNPGKLSVPSIVTIPAGQVSSAFSLTLVDNSIADGQTNVTVTASAAGFTNGTASILVTDDESPTIPFNPRPGNFATNILANTNLQWSSITTTTVTNELILNGNFESGSLTNWTTVAGVSGTFVINNGTVDPPSPDGPLPPFAGSYSALGRESGGGIFYMYQTILIPSNVVSAQLSWAHRVRNFYTAFSSSQQFQVRITDTNNVVLATAFTTGPSNTLLGGWVQTNYNLIAQAGKKVRVMFWVNPGSYYLDAHVDSVSVQVTTSSNATPVGILTNDVYFGTNPAPGPAELQGSTTNSAWTLPLLAPLTTYYWQVVARKVGAATSPVWQFTTAGVDHFAWNTIPSPQFVNQPFSATITAQDKFNSIVSNYAGQVSLTAGVPGFGTQFGENFETGNFSGWLNGAGSYTRSVVNNTAAGGNYSFTLIGGNSAHYDGISHVLSNLTPSRITFSVRAGATNVAGGYFVVGTGPAVASNAIFFYMTSLGMDVYDGSTHHLVPYVANQWYKVAFLLNWTGKTVDYYVNDILQYTGIPFRGAVNNLSVLYLYNFNSTQAWWDEITFDNGNASSSLTISPTNSANFINGAWNGNIVVQQPATNVVLRADDGGSHSGASNPFDVNLTNDLAIRIVDSPHPVSVGATLTYTLAVTNTGPADATGVTLTNILPPNVTFISANSSQGTCVQNSNVITCDLGLVPGGTNAIITILVTPTIAGVSLTNVATISRAETDNYLGNNSATVITPVTTPTISIADAALVEGNIGTTNLLFNVTLATPSAQTITVNYATVAGSAVAGSDYLTTNGVLTFTPGITNGIISVAVLGDIQVETNETFLVNLSNPANGTLGRAQAVGTIINDDGFAGYVDHFVWSAIASPQFASQGFAVTISALDSSNNIATNFSGAVALSSANAAISPAVSDNFSNGIWSGSIAVLQRVTNTVLTANDGNGHFGLSNPFEVAPTNLPPVILSQPTNQTIFVGGSATFGVIADGTPPLGFQWSVNGTNIPGATGSLIALTNTMFNQAGLYAVMVTNNYGFNLSSNALLTVNPPPPCVPPSTGLVGWWPGEGNGSDVVGTNTASLTGGVTFAAGEVGQAFSLNSNTVVKATASPSLDVGQANGFTLEAWIKPTDVTQARPLFEWNNSSGWGAHFYIAPGQPGTATPGPGQLYANIVDIFGSWHQMSSPGGTVASNVFQHVALTYDKSSGLAAIYYNGQIVSQQNFGSFTPLTAFDFYLGRRPAPSAEVADFEGLIDEPSIYNRALATNEIANIFNAGVAGKCAPNHPPVAGSTFTLGANIGVLATVKIIGGKHSPTDVDNDPLTITAVSGAVNGTTSTDGTNVTYIATGGTNDSFNCTISDGRGGTAIQTVNVVITASGGLGYNQLSAQSLGGGTNVLTFLGTPGFNYALDRTTNLVPPVVWISQGIKAASSNGFLIFTNVTPLSPVFYRTRYVP